MLHFKPMSCGSALGLGCTIQYQRGMPISRCTVVALQGTLVGNKVYLFGGEDVARRPHGDLFVLDLADMEWQLPEVSGVYMQDKRVRDSVHSLQCIYQHHPLQVNDLEC